MRWFTLLLICVSIYALATAPIAKAADAEVSLTAEQKKPITGFWVGALGGFGLGERYATGHWNKKATVFAVLDGTFVGGFAGLSTISGGQGTLAHAFMIGLAFGFVIERVKQGYEAKCEVEAFNDEIRHHIEPLKRPDMGKIFSVDVLALQF